MNRIWQNFSTRAAHPAVIEAASGAVTTYAQLGEQVASALQTLKTLAADEMVGIALQKSATAYAAVIACLARGNPFVPLHPSWPIERRATIAAAAQLKYIFSESHLAAAPLHGQPAKSDSRLAYVLFTSGTTGTPKGVMISRAALAHAVSGLEGILQPRPEDRFSQNFDLSFDLSLGEILLALASGAVLIPIPEIALAPALVARHGITVWGSVPRAAEMLLRSGAAVNLPSLRFSLFCGEALKPAVAAGWASAAPKSEVYNFYGPTEVTLYVSAHRYGGEEDIVPIGNAWSEHEFRLDDDGELWISGPQLADGYLNLPQETAAQFVIHEGRRWYRTGDLARRRADGLYEFAGRRDRQVKVQGQRLELEEVEAALTRVQPEAAWAAVLAPDGSQVWAVTTSAELNVGEILQRTAELLPPAAVPRAVYFTPEWPLNRNGKLDGAALMAQISSLRRLFP